MPFSFKKAFSRSRCWQIATAPGVQPDPGRHGFERLPGDIFKLHGRDGGSGDELLQSLRGIEGGIDRFVSHHDGRSLQAAGPD